LLVNLTHQLYFIILWLCWCKCDYVPIGTCLLVIIHNKLLYDDWWLLYLLELLHL